MKKRIYEIIEASKANDRWSRVYDLFMMTTIIISLIPLLFKVTTPILHIIDIGTVIIFIVDYILRWLTVDFKLEKGKWSYLIYPVSPMAIVDLLSILPSITIINNGFKVLKVFRLFRTFRVFRAFKLFRYSKSFEIIGNVLHKQKESLAAVCVLASGYILISALIVFNVEPETFGDFFEAIYWATVSLTTVGYGDIYPVTVLGRIITMISSIFGIAIVALPAGIITAGYMNEINKNKKDIDGKNEL